MGKIPTKKTSGRKQARPEFDEDAQWTEEYLSQFTVAILKDVIQKLNIRVNGRLKAELIQGMIDYRSTEQQQTNESASQSGGDAPQTTRVKRKRDVAESDDEEGEKEEERPAKQPRRGHRQAGAKPKYTELSSDEEEAEQKAPPPQTPARRNDQNIVSSPPPRPQRKSIARKVYPTSNTSDEGSLSSGRSRSPELLVRDPSPPAAVEREASVDQEAPVLFAEEAPPTEVVNRNGDGAEAPAAPSTHRRTVPTPFKQIREALYGGSGARPRVLSIPQNHIEPRPTEAEGSLFSQSPEDPSSPVPVKREVFVDHEAVMEPAEEAPLKPHPTVLMRSREGVNGDDEAHSSGGVEAPAAHETQPTPREALDGDSSAARDRVLAAMKDCFGPRPTVPMPPHEELDAGNSPLSDADDALQMGEMDNSTWESENPLSAAYDALFFKTDTEEKSVDEMEAEFNKFFDEKSTEIAEGHLAMSRLNATFLAIRALHTEMMEDVDLMTTLRYAAGEQAALLKPQDREFPVERFSELI